MRKVLVFLDNPNLWVGWSEKAEQRTDRFRVGWLDENLVLHETDTKPKPARKKKATPKAKSRPAVEDVDLEDLTAGLDDAFADT